MNVAVVVFFLGMERIKGCLLTITAQKRNVNILLRNISLVSFLYHELFVVKILLALCRKWIVLINGYTFEILWLDSMVLKIFSNINHSMILWLDLYAFLKFSILNREEAGARDQINLSNSLSVRQIHMWIIFLAALSVFNIINLKLLFRWVFFKSTVNLQTQMKCQNERYLFILQYYIFVWVSSSFIKQ